MHIRCDGQVALVTGAAQGIGRAIAEGLHTAGAIARLADRDEIAWADATPAFVTHRTDLGRRDAAQALVADVVRRSGRLDILVNSAGGVRGQVGKPIEAVTEAQWRVIFESNVDSAFWLAQAATPAMRANGFGCLVA